MIYELVLKRWLWCELWPKINTEFLKFLSANIWNFNAYNKDGQNALNGMFLF